MTNYEEKAAAAPAERAGTGPAGLVLVLLGLLVLAFAGWRTIATADIWTHIACGRDILHSGIPHQANLTFALPAGTPWVNATWLYDLGAAALWKAGGAQLVTLGHIAAVALAFLILALTALRRTENVAWPVALSLAVTTVLLLPVFSPSPVLVALVFVAAFLAKLSRGSCWRLARVALPVLQVLWTNTHPSFVLGPLLAALFAIDALNDERRGDQPEISSRTLGLFAGLLLLLTFANPYGFGLHAWLARVWLTPALNLSLDGASSFAPEFEPTLLRFAPYAALALAASGLLTVRQRLSFGFTGAAAVGAFLAVRQPGLAPLSATLLFPFLAVSIAALTGSAGRHARAAGAATLAALAALAVFIASGKHLERFGLAAQVGLGVQSDLFPSDAATVIAKPGFPGRAINLAPDGGFLATRLPRREIFCDTRGSLYGLPFYAHLAAALGGDAKALRDLETAHRPGALILNCAWPAAGNAVRMLTGQGRWALAYFDGTSAILVRNTAENLPLLRDRHLQRAGLEKLEAARRACAAQADRMFGNGNHARLISAGHFYLGMEKFAEAEVVFRQLTESTPRMHSAWLGLGLSLDQLGRHEEAMPPLRRAAQMRPKDPLPLLCLSRALRATGKTRESDEAVEQARALNADFTAAFLKHPPRPRPERR